MIYNIIHQRYDLPLGLYFQVKFDTVERPNKWITISNIPALDYFIYEGIETKEEILKIIQWIISNFEIYVDNEIFETVIEIEKFNIIQIKLINQILLRYNTEILKYSINNNSYNNDSIKKS